MAISHWTVTLEPAERERFRSATDKRPLEFALRHLRGEINTDLAAIVELGTRNDSITAEDVRIARQAAERRLQRLQRLLEAFPDLLGEQPREELLAPMTQAIEECDRLLREEFPQPAPTPPSAPPVAATGYTAYE